MHRSWMERVKKSQRCGAAFGFADCNGVVRCPHGAVQRHSEATCSENTDADVGGAPQTSVSRKQSEAARFDPPEGSNPSGNE
jgi:hypothetical protein